MGKHIKISIITVSLNSETTIEDTIKSVQAQHYDNLEYIIIDGKSTDGTLNIIERYSDIVTNYISEPDNGISDAFNKGIQMATGELIGIINSDDMLAENSLNIIGELDLENVDVIYGNCIVFGKGEKPYRSKPFPNLDELKEQMALIHPATFIKKDAYEKYGAFDLNYKCCMDRELLLRMYLAGANFRYINADLAKMRLGGINQRTYLNITIPEGKNISIKYGLSPIKAYWVAVRNGTRYRAVCFIRKFKIANSIRRIIHSKNVELNIWNI